MERDMADQFHLASKTKKSKQRQKPGDKTGASTWKDQMISQRRRQLDEGKEHQMDASTPGTPGTRIRDKNE